jgi:hypothetical protein
MSDATTLLSTALLVLAPLIATGQQQPVTDQRLILWLDAQALRGDGDQSTIARPAHDVPLDRWADRSSRGNDAVQLAVEHRPTLRSSGSGVNTVHFEASRQQYLSARPNALFNVSQFTAFVVARAVSDRANMWLFGKNDWGPPWTGYGIAVSQDGLHPWLHLGLGRDRVAKGVQLRHQQSIDRELSIVEVCYDGQRASQVLNGRRDVGVAVHAGILPNSHDLLIGAGPQSTPPCEYLQGDIAEILLYGEALDSAERRQTRQYLAAKYGVALTDDNAADNATVEQRLPMTAEDATPETRTLSPQEARTVLERDWLHQAAGQPLRERTATEIRRTRELSARIEHGTAVNRGDIRAALARLDGLEQRLAAATGQQPDDAIMQEIYLAVRRVKREVMFRDPAVDFSQLLFIDVPYPQGGEWPHEALHHLGKRASSGGRLLVLDGLDPGGAVRRLMADRTGAFLRPDLSFDGQRILFCFKPDADRTYHLYEVNVDGSGLRQLTSGQYDDISPAYLPDGKILFCTTRGNSYVRCGPYIESTILARCAADGHDIYLLSAGNEPDYTPTLLPDGRVLYTRWEYTDKEQVRVQSLWTVNPDGTGVSVYWGNQSYWPDILFEARPIPGCDRAMFSGVGHHDIFNGSIGIVDRNEGLNYPDGLTKVTPDVPWGEVGDGPAERRQCAAYDASGDFAAYRCPYPLSERLFLVSARRSNKHPHGGGEQDDLYFHLYLMDVEGNRELIYEGAYNIFYAMPLKPRAVPPVIPDRVQWPGREQDGQTVARGVLLSGDVYAGLPRVPRGTAKYLRVIQQDSTTFSLGCKSQQAGDTQTQPQMLGGPPLSLTVVDGIKRILGTVPIEADGSVYFEVPPCKALHFQLLDEHQRAIQTMRSFANAMPGERRGCVGCHEMHSVAPSPSTAWALRRPPQQLVPPPWGVDYTLGYERDIQPILDRYCGACHEGEGAGRARYDLTLRSGAGVFREPYVTLVLGQVGDPAALMWPPIGGAGGIASWLIPVAMPPQTMLKTVPPMTALSFQSPLVELARSGKHYGVQLDALSLQKLMAWIDLLCPYRGEPEVRAMADPDPAPFLAQQWPIVPRMRTAPIVRREYQQDEYSCQEDRLQQDAAGHWWPPVPLPAGVHRP